MRQQWRSQPFGIAPPPQMYGQNKKDSLHSTCDVFARASASENNYSGLKIFVTSANIVVSLLLLMVCAL